MNAALEKMLLELPQAGQATAFDAWWHMQLMACEGYFNAL